MTTIMTRKFFTSMGRAVPPDLAYVVDGQRITWADVMQTRRERQQMILDRRRKDYTGTWRPLLLRVRYYDIPIYTGYHAYFHAPGGYEHWVRESQYQHPLLQLLPLPPLFPTGDWYDWMRHFSRAYRTGTHDGRPAGSLILWARMTGSGRWSHPHEFALTPGGHA